MSSATARLAPRVVRSGRDRLRVHLAGWDGRDEEKLERSLARLAGVVAASARGSTRNALICFEPEHTNVRELLDRVARLPARRQRHEADDPENGRPPRRPFHLPAAHVADVLKDQAGRLSRARIAVRGLDRDPQLARRVVEALERRPEIKRAVASALTGRVLVEFSERVTSLQDILAEVSELELPERPGEDHPAHPLDPAPIIQSGTRAIGSAIGFSLLTVRRALNLPSAPVPAAVPAAVAGVLGIADGAPPVRDGLRRALGPDRAQLILSGSAIVSLTLAGSPLGLMVAGAGALRLFTEARLRREAWHDYEGRLEHAPLAQPGAVVRVQVGERVPVRARVLEGRGTVLTSDGLPHAVGPPGEVSGGARLIWGGLVLELLGDAPFTPSARPGDPRPDRLHHYMAVIGPASLACAAVHAIGHRSLSAAFSALLLVNPRPALIGSDSADTGAAAHVLRSGVTVVGTRPDRQIRRPDVVLIDGARMLTDGLEQTRIIPTQDGDREALEETVSAMIGAAGAPWGPSRASTRVNVTEAEFDGSGVSATVGGRVLRLAPAEAAGDAYADPVTDAGEVPLVLVDERAGRTLASVCLRPKLARGVAELRRRCAAHGVELVLVERGDRRASRGVARRATVPLIVEASLVDVVRERQRRGDRVAVLADSPAAAEAFSTCDLAVGLSSGRSSRFSARADLLAPGLPAAAAIIHAGARRDQAVDISVGLSCAANLAGAFWGWQGDPGLLRASNATYVGALAAIVTGWERLRGGRRSRSVIRRLVDPRPERWGRLEIEDLFAALDATAEGLSGEEARRRYRAPPARAGRNALMAAMADQLNSPLVAVLGAGAGLSLMMGALADVGIIAAVIAGNAAVGAWQEHLAENAAQALERLGAARARVLRDGAVTEVDADEVVPGDILVVASGDRVVADARVLVEEGLEVDEAALTGESLPVSKAPDAPEPHRRIILEGSDVTVGAGRAVVVAVGSDTRLGATAAALETEESGDSPLGRRLDHLFRQGLPVIVGGGALVTLAGIAWGGSPMSQLIVGSSVAVAAVPEGLPLLAGVAEAAVARRLASRSALVRRLSAVEALGRVDVVCCDKTGTMTRGRLALTLVDDLHAEHELPGAGVGTIASAPPSVRAVLEAAGLASPAPEAADAGAHPTDAAVLTAVRAAGLDAAIESERRAEAPFDPARGLHATVVADRMCVKGAVEVLARRCVSARDPDHGDRELAESGRAALVARAEALAAHGLRVLMVAEGPADGSVDDPSGLTALGFIGISDPLREGVPEAVRRCHEAGIRVIMLTGDHPATARSIARQAGLPLANGAVLTGDEIAAADNGNLGERLASATVIARITPVDKLQVVEALQRAGHIVAMTGDGVNDAPALRLADVGVSMGAGGTEVARQAADLVLGDDRFATLTEALVEGRSLWQNLHGALGLLLGGNLGEIGLMAGAALLGRTSLLGARQILAINVVTDVLPAVAVAVQPPRERDLRALAAEASESFDRRLLSDIVRRGTATAVPALAAVVLASALGAQATTVAFSSIIVTQLAQTLEAGRAGERLSPSVLGAIAGSGGVLGLSLALPPLRRFLGLQAPTPLSLGLIAATAPAATLIAGRFVSRPASFPSVPAGRGEGVPRLGPGPTTAGAAA